MLFIASEFAQGLYADATLLAAFDLENDRLHGNRAETKGSARKGGSKKRSYPHIWMQLPFIQFAFFPNDTTYIDANKFSKAKSVSTESVSSSSVFPLDLLQYSRFPISLGKHCKSCCTYNFKFNGSAKGKQCIVIELNEWKPSVFLMPPRNIYTRLNGTINSECNFELPMFHFPRRFLQIDYLRLKMKKVLFLRLIARRHMISSN